MRLHPDIQDIGDVQRYCFNCAFPMEMASDGRCLRIFVPHDIARSGSVLGNSFTSVLNQQDTRIALDAFMSMDTGPFKPRMVETVEGSVIYVTNGDANARHHGLVQWQCHYFWDGQPRKGLYEITLQQAGLELFNMHRTPWSVGRGELEEGRRIGIALSDRFGVITSKNSDYPQVVWKTKVIGEIIGDRLNLERKYIDLTRVVDALLGK